MYSDDFIRDVRRCYPDSKDIIAAAENGDYFLGRYLDDNSSDTVSIEYILTHSFDEIRQRALIEKQKSELYSRWVSGDCYTDKGLRESYCPVNWLQNSSNPRRYELAEVICKGAKYTSYYPDCERYGCKHECWSKYDCEMERSRK